MTGRVKIGKDGKAAGIKTFNGFQADLLTASLYDSNGDPATADFIESLPSSTQQNLFNRAQELSGVETNEEKDNEKEAKNG